MAEEIKEDLKDAYEHISSVEESFKTIFGKSVEVMTTIVRSGGTSGNVYVPRKYKNNPVTLIIWPEIDDDSNKFKPKE